MKRCAAACSQAPRCAPPCRRRKLPTWRCFWPPARASTSPASRSRCAAARGIWSEFPRRRRFMIRVVIQAILVALFALPAAAQQWPAKPGEFIVPYPPRGYTFVFGFDAHAVNGALLPNAGYDPLKDFASVMVVGTAPYAIATLASKPYSNFGDVLKAAKANPGAGSVGAVGNGTLAHLILVLAQQSGGFKINHIPFKGGGPMTQAALGGPGGGGLGADAP